MDPLSFYLDKSDPVAWKAVGQLAAAATASAREALDLAEAVTRLPEQESLHISQLMAASVLSDAQYSAVQWLAMTMNLTNRTSILSHHPVRPRR